MLTLDSTKIKLVWLRASMLLALLASVYVAGHALGGDPVARFERSYTTQGPARLKISNVNGRIHVTAWDKKTISVRANADPSVRIQDEVAGDDITISVKRDIIRIKRADFEVFVPKNTSITLKTFMGDIEVRGVAGHVSINSIDSNVRLMDLNSPSVDVKVTSGDIYFDGQLHDGGSYGLQSIRGDIDVTLPAATPFNLNARALSENINLGGFITNLTRSARGSKGVYGTYLNGNSRLTLTAFAGRILLHKK